MVNQTHIEESGTERADAASFASLGDRLLAQVVDGLVGFGLFFFLGMVLAPRFGGATESGFSLTGSHALLVSAIVAVLMLGYLILFEAAFGATLGKLTAGIRVQTAAGQPISMRASVIRNLIRIVDVIGVYLVGAISFLLTKRNQRLGDLAAGTIVVQRETGRLVRVGALLATVLVAIGGVMGGFRLRPGYPSLDQYAPKDLAATIKAVSLSWSERSRFDPTKVGTEFAEGVKQVAVWYRWEGATKSRRIDIHWSKDGQVVLEQWQVLEDPAGSVSWFLARAEGGPLPVGNYEVKLLENGKPVTAIPFRIAVKK